MKELPVVTNLPASMHREIGRVIVLHSHLEYIMGRIVQELLGIDPKQSRVAVREPRGKEVFNMICELAELRGVSISEKEYKSLVDALDSTKQQRDALGHGVWMREPDSNRLFLRLLHGSWQPEKGMKGKVRRRVHPEGAEYGIPEIASTRELIELTITAAKAFHLELRSALSSSQRKHKQQSRNQSPRPAPSRAKRKHPQKASKG